jgi:hypothetical protein
VKLPVALLALLLTSYSAFAQQELSGGELRLQSEEVETYSRDNRDPLGWWPFISLNMGLLDREGDKAGDGHNLQAKGLFSFYDLSRDFNLEAGAGLQNSDANNEASISGLLEGGARLRWLSRWEAGPLVNFFVGNGDDYGSSSPDITTFVGANLLYDLPLANGDLLRAGGRWMTDVGVPGEFANIFMFEVHYGLPFGEKNVVTQEKPRSEHLARLAFENSEWEGPQLAYSTLQVDPNTTDRNRLARLGEELMQDNDLVTEVRVIGHADERGSTYANQMLSEARATSVANALVFAGFPKERIQIIGMGESRPLVPGDTPNAWEHNRRVELEFRGVRDLEQLRSLLRETGIE